MLSTKFFVCCIGAMFSLTWGWTDLHFESWIGLQCHPSVPGHAGGYHEHSFALIFWRCRCVYMDHICTTLCWKWLIFNKSRFATMKPNDILLEVWFERPHCNYFALKCRNATANTTKTAASVVPFMLSLGKFKCKQFYSYKYHYCSQRGQFY